MFVALGFTAVFVQIQLRSRRMSPLLEAAGQEPVLHREPVAVRVRHHGGAWHDVKDQPGMRAEVIVHEHHVEIAFSGRSRELGAGLGCEWVLKNSNTKMHRERVGWLGTPLIARDSIVLHNEVDDPDGAVDVALAAKEPSDLWSALRRAGVLPG